MTGKSGTMAHTADLGLWVEAESLRALFESAPVALAELMIRGHRQGRVAWLPFTAQAGELAELLVRLLAEVVYLWDAERLLVVAVKVNQVRPAFLEARLGVIPADAAELSPGEPVKAVTYHQAKVEPMGDRWRAEVVLDV